MSQNGTIQVAAALPVHGGVPTAAVAPPIDQPTANNRNLPSSGLFWLLLSFLGVIGCLGGGLTLLKDYDEWKNALTGECMYNTTKAIACTKKLNNKGKTCGAWKAVHVYLISNESEAFERCPTTTLSGSDCRRCGMSKQDVLLTPPENDDGEWHTCYVKPYVNSCGVTFTKINEMDRVGGILLIILCVMFVIGFVITLVTQPDAEKKPMANTELAEDTSKENKKTSTIFVGEAERDTHANNEVANCQVKPHSTL